MTAEVVDITPDHNPISLTKDMTKLAPDSCAGFYILLKEDGSLHWDMCAMSKRDMLWALEKARIKLMND